MVDMALGALKQTVASHEETEHCFYSAFEHSSVGTVILSPKGVFKYVNKAYCKFVGYQEHELLAQHFSLVLDAEELNAKKTFPNQSLANEIGDHQHERRYRHKLGHDIWGLVSTSMWYQNNGRLNGLIIQIQDISERKRSEEALQYSQKTLLTLMNNLPGMAYRARNNRDRTMEFVSTGCFALTGYQPNDLTRGTVSFAKLIYPDDRNTVWDHLQHALRERQPYQVIYRLISAKGEEKWVKEQGCGVFSEQGDLLVLEGFVTDITESHKMALTLAHQATHDALTGLVNRRQFGQRLERALAHTKVYGTRHALCYLDLDQFKIVNDTVGHRAGDELLRQVAKLLKSKVRFRDTLARLGGDEFGLLLENCPLDNALTIAETLVSELRELRFVWEDRCFTVGVSIGLVSITADATSTEQLLSHADIACYAAKDLGRNRVHVYQAQDRELVKRHAELLHVANLRKALEQERFALYCQPIKPLSPDAPACQHYEVLIRLIDLQGNILPPGAFIPAAERYGLMGAIDKWVIQALLSQYRMLLNTPANMLMAINLSGNSLNDDTLLDFVRHQLAVSKVAPERLCFEITETAAVSNLTQASRFITEMKKIGCQFALDDFGSGLSSFAYLKHFPVDYLKIDGSFIKDLPDDPTNQAIVAAINEVGHVMGIRTIAEYVESEAVLDAVKALNVDYGQGYAVEKPIPLQQMQQHFIATQNVISINSKSTRSKSTN